MADDDVTKIETWLADTFWGTDVYRGKPKKIRKDAGALLDFLATAGLLVRPVTPTPVCSCDATGAPEFPHRPWCELNHPHHPCDGRWCRFAPAAPAPADDEYPEISGAGVPYAWKPKPGELVTGKARSTLDSDPVGKYVDTMGDTARIDVTDTRRKDYPDVLSSLAYVDADTLRPADRTEGAPADEAAIERAAKAIYEVMHARLTGADPWEAYGYRGLYRDIARAAVAAWRDEQHHMGDGCHDRWTAHVEALTEAPKVRAAKAALRGEVT